MYFTSSTFALPLMSYGNYSYHVFNIFMKMCINLSFSTFFPSYGSYQPQNTWFKTKCGFFHVYNGVYMSFSIIQISPCKKITRISCESSQLTMFYITVFVMHGIYNSVCHAWDPQTWKVYIVHIFHITVFVVLGILRLEKCTLFKYFI